MLKPLGDGAKHAAKKKPAIVLLSPVAAVRLRHAGIKNPYLAAAAAKDAGVPLSLFCALLMQETGGGTNEWGHDPTIFVGGYDQHHNIHYGPYVTEAGYRAYLAQRGPQGGGGMQGVGPCQLTYFSYQDQADQLGGCWKPGPNMIVGARLLAANVRRDGLFAGVAAYNGTGPAAERYARSVLAMQTRFAPIVT